MSAMAYVDGPRRGRPPGRATPPEFVAGFSIRVLTTAERASAFKGQAKSRSMQPYLDLIREMEGGVAYEIGTDGLTVRAFHFWLNKAAKQLDLKLRWAKVPRDADKVIVELADAP